MAVTGSTPAETPETSQTETVAADGPRPLRRTVLASTLGQLVEWFDWAVYATFAPYFSPQFFPHTSETAALLSTFAVFAVSFVIRPLGSVLFGRFADRFGRRPAFTASILAMAGGMAVMALTPPASEIGLAAPILLIFGRLVQGLSAGGEMPTGSAFLSEAVPPRRRGFYASFVFVGVGSGTLLAALFGAVMSAALDEHQLASWGWRLAFGLGAVLCLYGLRMRRRLPETEAFESSDGTRRSGLRMLFTGHWRQVLRVIGFVAGGTVSYYTFGVYLPTYLHRSAGMSSTASFVVTSVAVLAYTCGMPLWGLMTDRFGRRPVMAGGAFGVAVLVVPLSLLLPHSGPVLAAVALCVAMALVGMSSGTSPALMSEQFPTAVRALGIGVPYALATAVFGGTAPYLAEWLSENGVQVVYFCWASLLCLVSSVVMARMPETAGSTLLDREDHK